MVWRNLESKLAKWQEERDARQGFVDCPWGRWRVPGWHVYELEQLLAEVNRLRAEAGKEPIDALRLSRAESTCQGHFDYTHKLALIAASLVSEP